MEALTHIPSAGRGEIRFDLLWIEGIEAGRGKFQRLVADLVHAQTSEAREVRENPGDWGIDTFVGSLAGGHIQVWQAKYFIEGFGATQKRQVRDSFRSLLTKANARGIRVVEWTLVMPRNMDALTIVWWDRWKTKTRDQTGVKISLWGETELRAKLLVASNSPIKDQYFGSVQAGSPVERIKLYMPRGDPENLLTFAGRAVESVGRSKEREELLAFAEDESPFQWWAWTGPAGMGKSRLALEFLRDLPAGWHAGFLGDVNDTQLTQAPFAEPTFVIVDYASERAAWLSQFFLTLARSKDTSTPSVRVLVLERQASGLWWDALTRGRHTSDAYDINSSMYALPRELTGLSEAELMQLSEAAARKLGQPLSATMIDNIQTRAKSFDEQIRPLFGLLAVLDELDGLGDSRDEVIRGVLIRAESQLAAKIAQPGLLRRCRSLLMLATLAGGLSVNDYLSASTSQKMFDMLPHVSDDVEDEVLNTLLRGYEPDLLGEAYILDRLGESGLESGLAQTMVSAAWADHRLSYCGFVERAATDFPDGEALGDLLFLDRPTSFTDADDKAWAELVVSVVPLLSRADHPLCGRILESLKDLASQRNIDAIWELATQASFEIARLALFSGSDDASALLADSLAMAKPEWDVYAWILNGRGVSKLDHDDESGAMQDFTTVIELPTVRDEPRACSLNNRADMYHRSGDLELSVDDRTAVLALEHTSYNRRFIAYHRRAQTLVELGRVDEAVGDLHSILDTDDIATEQKMSSRLLLAQILATDRRAEAIDELRLVLASPRNFDLVLARATELLNDLA
jgi:hypothetical protein